MTYLILYLAVTIAGYFIGTKLKRSGQSLPWVGKTQTVVIVVLVFLMGSRIGANDEIVASLDTIGLVSLAYTLIIMAATCLAYSIARRLLGFDRYGVRRKDQSAGGHVKAGQSGKAAAQPVSEARTQPTSEAAASEAEKGSHGGINRLTILIIVFVGLGILAGFLVLPEGFMAWTGLLLTISLCVLLVLIGIDIGTEGTLAENFRSAGWRVVVFPFVSMVAMVAAAVVAAVILPLGLQDSLCVGGGFAWYSLAPAMLAEYSTRISAISFMHNVFREILGILLIPVVAGKIGYIESYGLPGSPSMDVCLPVVERSTSSDVAVYSFINGAILSAAVPILITIFMNL